MFHVVKRQKRLWIDGAGGEPVYTPPNFVKLQSREPMKALAQRFTDVKSRDLDAIIDFETQNRPKRR